MTPTRPNKQKPNGFRSVFQPNTEGLEHLSAEREAGREMILARNTVDRCTLQDLPGLSLTVKELNRSIYYPACGYDLEAVKTFCDMSDLFIYCDWLFQPEDIGPKLKQAAIQQGIDLLSCGMYRWSRMRGVGQLPEGFAYNTYERKHRREVDGNDGWRRNQSPEAIVVAEFKVKDKRVRLVYLCDEAINAYCKVYKSGGLAPQMLVTIRSGGGLGGGYIHLEESDGVFNRLFSVCAIKPAMWCRGGPQGWSKMPGLYSEVVSDRVYDVWRDGPDSAAVYRIPKPGERRPKPVPPKNPLEPTPGKMPKRKVTLLPWLKDDSGS